jgi:AcrR family transcriptional regulator
VKAAPRRSERRNRPRHKRKAIDIEDPRAVRSSQALTDAFLELLEAKPLEQISIRDIAATAGIGYTTFFRHHTGKEALLEHVAAEQIRTLFDLALPVMDAYDVHAGSTALFTYVDAHRSLWSTLLTGGAAGTVRAEFLRLASEVAASQGRSDTWLPADAGAILIVGGTLDLLTWWLRQRSPLPIKRIVEIHEHVVVAPAIEASSATRRRRPMR